MSRFDARAPADVARLTHEHPLAWVVSIDAGAFHASPLPLRTRCDAEGRMQRIVGHFARRNPQVEALRRSPQAMFLFLGPHGYISPSWMTDRTQVSTWNYAMAVCHASVRFLDDGDELRAAMRDLVDSQEADRPGRWHLDEMGPRYDRLAQAIIGFEATVSDVRSRFKLGQDERDDVYADITRALGAQGEASALLLNWMREFNAAR